MKKCRGCGITLQTQNENSVGYVKDINQCYCQRCFRLSHYGDVSNLHNNYVTNKTILDIYDKYKSALFVLIIDVLDSLVIDDDDILDLFKDFDVVLVINKIDILPKNFTDKKIDNIFTKKLFSINKKYPNIKSAILTNKYENKFNDNFIDVLNEFNVSTVVFAGRANAGKSSLINKLLNRDDITTSFYPGTTLDEIEIDYKNFVFIDTPGLVDVNSYSTYLSYDKYKYSKIDKTIKPQVFQIKDNQSYFYEGLFWVDVEPIKECSISFYINNQNLIHRTKLNNASEYYKNNYHNFKLKVKPLVCSYYNIDDYKLFVIKGLGLFKINGKCKIKIHSLENVKIYESEIRL